MRDEKKIVMAQKLFLKMKGLATMKKMSAQIIEDLENENEELKERVKKMEWQDKDISNKPIPSWKMFWGHLTFGFQERTTATKIQRWWKKVSEEKKVMMMKDCHQLVFMFLTV